MVSRAIDVVQWGCCFDFARLMRLLALCISKREDEDVAHLIGINIDRPKPPGDTGVGEEELICFGDIGRGLVHVCRFAFEGLDFLQGSPWTKDIEERTIQRDKVFLLQLF